MNIRFSFGVLPNHRHRHPLDLPIEHDAFLPIGMRIAASSPENNR